MASGDLLEIAPKRQSGPVNCQNIKITILHPTCKNPELDRSQVRPDIKILMV